MNLPAPLSINDRVIADHSADINNDSFACEILLELQ
jgi:hypothetical protein